MSADKQNERATEVTPPVAAVERASALPAAYPQSNWFPLSHGTPPRTFVPVSDDLLAALREAEGYVVAEVVGDVDGQPEVRYEGTWRCYLAQGGA